MDTSNDGVKLPNNSFLSAIPPLTRYTNTFAAIVYKRT